MEQIPVEEARERLAELVAAAMRGEHVVITSDPLHAVQLVPVVRRTEPRTPGTARGLVVMADDFDDPLEDFDAYSR